MGTALERARRVIRGRPDRRAGPPRRLRGHRPRLDRGAGSRSACCRPTSPSRGRVAARTTASCAVDDGTARSGRHVAAVGGRCNCWDSRAPSCSWSSPSCGSRGTSAPRGSRRARGSNHRRAPRCARGQTRTSAPRRSRRRRARRWRRSSRRSEPRSPPRMRSTHRFGRGSRNGCTTRSDVQPRRRARATRRSCRPRRIVRPTPSRSSGRRRRG